MNIKKSQTSYKIIPPPSNVNQENARIWAGWNELGDKEVAREASAKGLYVDLAINFIATRKNLTLEDTRIWFKEEVLKWVSELLQRKQIFRASHILSNIQLDPFVELTKVFCETENKELREYIGTHLIKNKQLEDRINNYWTLLALIENNEETFSTLIGKYNRCLNIQMFQNMSCDEVSEIATCVFFTTYDFRLELLLTPEQFWIFMLTHNKIKLLKLWITVQFATNVQAPDYCDINLSTHILDKLIHLFKIFAITPYMIDTITNCDISPNTKQLILNELCKYGIFISDDRTNFPKLLNRLKEAQCVTAYKDILTLKTSTVTLEEFNFLLVDFCMQNELYNVIGLFITDIHVLDKLLDKYDSKHLILLSNIKRTDLNCKSSLQRNILQVSQFLNPDLHSYFRLNPILLLALVLFNESSFSEVLDRQILSINNVEINLKTLFTSLPLFNLIYEKYNNILQKPEFTFLNMLQHHGEIHIDKLLNLQRDSVIPHFNRKDLVEAFGYRKELGFLLFLRQSRPSIASKIFILDCLQKHDCITDCDKIKASAKARKLATKCILNSSVTAACIAFLEMIGYSSDELRVHVEAASLIRSSDLFANAETNAEIIAKRLESAIMEKIHDKLHDFLEVLNSHDVLIKFCNVHSLNLPELLLKYYAHNNLWLPFLAFVQIYGYPLHQVCMLVQNFKNPTLLEHINHSVLHDIQINQQKEIVMGERDSRNYLLSRIGVRKSLDYNHVTSSNIDSENESFDLQEGEVLDKKVTLLQMLIKCHNSVDPPRALLQACQLYRNPLLAVLATSYEPDSVVTNWLTWLSVSCDLCQPLTNYETLSLCPNSVTELLKNVVKAKYVRTLQESFEIFLPRNPLKIFVQFLQECIKLNFDTNDLKEKLKTFHDKLKRIRSNSVISQLDQEITYINNKVWIQNLVVIFISFTLEYNFATLFDRIQFLNVLCELNVEEILNNSPNFSNLLNILRTLHSFNCDVDLDLSVIYDKIEYNKMIQHLIDKLVLKNEYKIAQMIADIENYPVDIIIIEKFKYIFNRSPVDFIWEDCNEAFKKHQILPGRVISFFQECSTMVTSFNDKYRVLKLAYDWALQFDQEEKDYLERQMWLMFLNVEDKSKINLCHVESFRKLYKDMQNDLKYLQQNAEKLAEADVPKLNECISILLKYNQFWEALRMEKIFGYKNADLEILSLCCNIAEGILLPNEFNAEQRMLLNNSHSGRGGHKQRRMPFRSTRQSSTSSASQTTSNVASTSLIDPVDNQALDNLLTIENLVDKLSSGIEIGQNILMMYRISVNIEIPYCIIIENDDHMKMLKDALEDDCKNKLEVVHDCIHVYKWSKQKTADFICEELVNAISWYIKSNLANLTMWDLNLDTEFHLILQFLPENCSLLGLKIYSYLNALHLSQTLSPTDFKTSEIALIVELLIRAHDCFTADCNMEGIMLVLKKCQTLISLLLTLKGWKLIVRLLIGVGRYTEMNYVFQILRENDQFEFLLSKGSKKDNGLKLALLDYLNKYCPDNRELYRIVALHFTLFSEVAQLWEKEAQNIVRNLIAISKLEMQNKEIDVDNEPFVLFTNTDGTNICLSKAMENYTHATEYHLQGEKFAKAMNSAKQAELLAVQLSKVKEVPLNETTVCFLNLNSIQIANLIATNRSLSFSQLLILIEAYNYTVDWASVLYEQYIVGNRADFLEHFMRCFPLTDGLVHDMSRQLLKSTYTATTVRNMKEILKNLSSVHAKYRIASELGFADVVEELLAGGQLAYLKDTVWKKGYKS